MARCYDLELPKVAELLNAEYKTHIKREFDIDLSFSLLKVCSSFFLKKKSHSASLMEIFEIFLLNYSLGILSPVYRLSGSISLNIF